jgi:hypothetical protein
VRVGELRVELNCRVPGTAYEFGEFAGRWLESAVGRLGAPLMADLEKAGPLSQDGLRDRSGEVPFGEPGSVWMSLVTSTAGVRGVRSSIDAWSSENWTKFVDRLQDLPVEASAKLSVLGADGYPDVPFLTASVTRYPEQPDWVVLTCDGSTRRDASAEDARSERRMWADFLRGYAETTDAGFGYLSDEADFAGPRTALEISLGLFPEETLGRLDSQVRGYSWITVISPGVAKLLGDADAIERTQAFDEVVVCGPLRCGSRRPRTSRSTTRSGSGGCSRRSRRCCRRDSQGATDERGSAGSSTRMRPSSRAGRRVWMSSDFGFWKSGAGDPEQESAVSPRGMRVGLRGFAFVGAVLALVAGFLTPLEKYSWTGSPDQARIIDPDALLVATLISVVAIALAVVAIRLSDEGGLLPGAVLLFAILLFGRLISVYVFSPELIWHQ